MILTKKRIIKFTFKL